MIATGEEKNLTFMLLAFYNSNGMTVVVVSLIVLKQDMARQYRGLGIKVGMWERKRSLDEV